MKDSRFTLEGQIVCTTLTCRFLCRRERRCCILRSSLRGEGRTCSRSCTHGSPSGSNDTTLYIVSANVIIPTTIELTGINIERNGYVLAHLNVKLFNTVLAKDIEDHLLRILTGDFHHILLCHP